MAVYKDGTKWRVVFRYTNWQGERKQNSKRGFETKREAVAWEYEEMLKVDAKLDMTFESFYAIYEKRIAELTDKDKELCEDIADKESTKDVLEQAVQNIAENLSVKEALVEKAEQRLSSINELLNKYRDPFDQRDKMIALQLKVNDLEEENATLKHKL